MRLLVPSYSSRRGTYAHLGYLLGVWVSSIVHFVVLPELLVVLFTRQVLHANVFVLIKLWRSFSSRPNAVIFNVTHFRSPCVRVKRAV